MPLWWLALGSLRRTSVLSSTSREPSQNKASPKFWECGPKIVANWLVVDLPLWKMMEFVSWDDEIPNWMENHKIHVPNHQPAKSIYDPVGWINAFTMRWTYCGWFRNPAPGRVTIGIPMKHCKSWGYNWINHLPTGAGFHNHPCSIYGIFFRLDELGWSMENLEIFQGRPFLFNLLWLMVPQFGIAKLAQITPISLWFMVDILTYLLWFINQQT